MPLAEDITAPEIEFERGDKKIMMRFDHNQMRASEYYWQMTVRTRLGYIGILNQAVSRTYCGLGALAYGALASHEMAHNARRRELPDVAAFDRIWDLGILLDIAEPMIKAALSSLPSAPASGGQEKNG